MTPPQLKAGDQKGRRNIENISEVETQTENRVKTFSRDSG